MGTLRPFTYSHRSLSIVLELNLTPHTDSARLDQTTPMLKSHLKTQEGDRHQRSYKPFF
ncbi:hypothetical protein BDR03DRAFT_943261 [Suillus americanus]|nr:hypothetical protein BDR03DRAFT_943261 [Suillus americanus]